MSVNDHASLFSTLFPYGSSYPYYFKVSGTSTSGSSTVSRAAVTDKHTAGYIPAQTSTTVISADSKTVTVNSGSGSTYVGLKEAAFTMSGDELKTKAIGGGYYPEDTLVKDLATATDIASVNSQANKIEAIRELVRNKSQGSSGGNTGGGGSSTNSDLTKAQKHVTLNITYPYDPESEAVLSWNNYTTSSTWDLTLGLSAVGSSPLLIKALNSGTNQYALTPADRSALSINGTSHLNIAYEGRIQPVRNGDILANSNIIKINILNVKAPSLNQSLYGAFLTFDSYFPELTGSTAVRCYYRVRRSDGTVGSLQSLDTEGSSREISLNPGDTVSAWYYAPGYIQSPTSTFTFLN